MEQQDGIIHGGGRPSSYKLATGERVPGVTTITSRFKDSGGLIHWAWDCGMNGKDYRATRDDAGSVGTLAHECIDNLSHRRPYPKIPSEMQEAVDSAVGSFAKWSASHNAKFLETEVPMISETHKFGGTFDWLLEVNGEIVLGDLKTSNRIYPEMLIQLGAYSILLQERGTEVTGAALLRVGKEHGDFHYHYFPRALLDRGGEAFLKMRELYDIDKQLRAVVG